MIPTLLPVTIGDSVFISLKTFPILSNTINNKKSQFPVDKSVPIWYIIVTAKQ